MAKFVRDALSTFSADMLSVIAGIACSVAVARVLGPEGKGTYALVILVPTMLALVGNLGIGQANAYLGGTRRQEWSKLASNSLLSALVIGLVLVSAFLVYFCLARPPFLEDIESRYMLAALFGVPFSLLGTYFRLILLGQGRMGLYNSVQAVPSIVGLLAVLLVLLVFGGGVFSVVVAWTATTILGAILSFVFAIGIGGLSHSFSLRLFRESVKFGFPVSLGNALQFLNYRVDMVIVSSLLDVTSVGYYSVAVGIAEVLWYLPSAVGTVVFSRTTALSPEEANEATPRICRNTVFLTALAAIALFFVSRYVVLLFFGTAFLPALKPLWILLPGIVALSVWKVLPNDLVARGKPAIMSVGAGISLALNVPLNLLLVPAMGISGAALASTISYTVTGTVVVVAFLRESNSSWSDTLVVKLADFRLYSSAIAGVGTRIQSAAYGWRSK